MEIKLTSEQLELVKNRLAENLKEEKDLREKQELGEQVNGWDFVALSNERGTLEDVIEKGYTEL